MRKDATAIDKVKYEEWLNDAEQSFKIANGLGQNLEVLGYSTGGTLAAYLALRHPQDIKALYLIAPALALSSKVFFSSLMLGQSSLDSLKICQNADATNWMCRLFKFSDDQAQVMLRDRIVTSPSAGYQVQSLINFIDRTFNSSEDQTDYYQSLLEVYNKLSVPILMVNSKSDNVINLDFNEKFIQSYKARKENILFEKSLGIKHIFINKSSVDAFLNTKPGYNLHFEEITSGVERLQ